VLRSRRKPHSDESRAVGVALRAAARFALVASMLGAEIASAGCRRDEGRSPYPVVMRVESDPGEGLSRASVSFLGREVGRTGSDGTVAIEIRGTEGEHVPIRISCPDGFVSPEKPTDVVLHRLADPNRRPEYAVRCSPVNRDMLLVVRADQGAGLPVVYLGHEVARTDESGAAHALLRVPYNDEVEVTLSTVEPGNERLRPQNPSIKFVSTNHEDIELFNVQFQLEAPKHPKAGSARQLPIRLH
jgi:hypothetical protein